MKTRPDQLPFAPLPSAFPLPPGDDQGEGPDPPPLADTLLPPISVLFTAQDISACVDRLARAVTNDVAGLQPLFVGVLRGSAIFLADLIRRLDFPLSFDFLAVSSYVGTNSSGAVRILKDLDESIYDRHVVLVEDIVDSGLTLAYLLDTLRRRRPASLRVCALLNKTGRRRALVQINYAGFCFERGFVVGYGMDYQQQYRNLPYIGVLQGGEQ